MEIDKPATHKKMLLKVLTVGGAMIDTIAIIESSRIELMKMRNADTSFLLLEEGRKTEAFEISTHCGGGAINTAVAMARLGCEVATIVKLGRDGRADTAGPIAAGTVMLAVGGHVTSLASLAGLRLPIRTHPLQAFVTTRYEQTFEPIVASSGLSCYASQTAKGEMLIGAEIDRAPGYAYDSGHHFLQSTAFRATVMLPFLRDLGVLRQWTGVCDMSTDYSPVMGQTGVGNLVITTGWGTWGFKAIPVGGEPMAELIATGRTPSLIAPFSLDRFARDRTMADRGSAGTH